MYLFQSSAGDELGILIGGVKCPACAGNLSPPKLHLNTDCWSCNACGKQIKCDLVIGIVNTLQQILFEGKCK